MIGSSDLIGLVPAPAFEQYGPALNLRKVETDIQFPGIDIYMMYNRSALNSSAFASFIEEISLPWDIAVVLAQNGNHTVKTYTTVIELRGITVTYPINYWLI